MSRTERGGGRPRREKTSKAEQRLLERVHLNAAGIDVGSGSHWVSVPDDRDPQPVREFKSFTHQLIELADWLDACGIETDGGCCTYVSSSGRRCDSREFLEFDHAEGWTRTRAHSIDGITLRCRAHNQQRARIDFGEPHMARFRRTGSESSSPHAGGEIRDREAPSSVT